MLRHSFLLVTLLFLTSSLGAQTTLWTIHSPYYGPRYLYLDDAFVPSDSLQSANLRVIYQYSSVIDTLENTIAEERMLLEVGSSVSKFSSYEHFQIDSLLRVSTLSVSSIALKVLSRKHLSPEFFESVFFNYPANRVTLTGRIVATDFVYDEPLPVFEWKITEETDSWCGYLIQKALCRFRGRDYEAWFAPDIPVPLGPWKFWGLPGLIIKIHDLAERYRFEASSIASEDTGFIGFPNYAYQRTSRKEYLKAKAQIIANYPLYQKYFNNNTGIIVMPREGYKPKILRYDFIELE